MLETYWEIISDEIENYILSSPTALNKIGIFSRIQNMKQKDFIFSSPWKTRLLCSNLYFCHFKFSNTILLPPVYYDDSRRWKWQRLVTFNLFFYFTHLRLTQILLFSVRNLFFLKMLQLVSDWWFSLISFPEKKFLTSWSKVWSATSSPCYHTFRSAWLFTIKFKIL